MDQKPYANAVLEQSLLSCLQREREREVQAGGGWNSGEGKPSRLPWAPPNKQDWFSVSSGTTLGVAGTVWSES